MLSLNSKFDIPKELDYTDKKENFNITFIRNLLKNVINDPELGLDEDTKCKYSSYLLIIFESYHSDTILREDHFDKLCLLLYTKKFEKIFYKLVDGNNITTNWNLNYNDLWDSINNLNNFKQILIIFERFLTNWKVNRILSNSKNSSTIVENKNHILLNWESFEIINQVWKYSIIWSILKSKIYILNKENNSILFDNKFFTDIKLDNTIAGLCLFIISDWINNFLLDLDNERLIWKEIFKWLKDLKNIKYLLDYSFNLKNWELIVPISINWIVYFYNKTKNILLKWSIKSDIKTISKPIYGMKWEVFIIYLWENSKVIKNIISWTDIWIEYNLKFINPLEFVIDNWNLLMYAEKSKDEKWLLNLTTWEFIQYEWLEYDKTEWIFYEKVKKFWILPWKKAI